jgi:hypothetical protein
MEIEAIAGMIFAFLMTVTILFTVGAITLLKPLMKHLGEFLEAKAEERQALGSRSPEDWDRLFDTLDAFGKRLEALEEKQEFTDKLLAKPSDKGGPA